MRRLATGAIVLAMAAGSIAMWIANPLVWLWLASRLSSSTQPSMGPYLLVIAGIAVTMWGCARGLGALNRLHGRLTGRGGRVRVQAPWLRSMRGERDTHRPVDTSVLDVVMVSSVAVACTVMAVWFFFFAGASI